VALDMRLVSSAVRGTISRWISCKSVARPTVGELRPIASAIADTRTRRAGQHLWGRGVKETSLALPAQAEAQKTRISQNIYACDL